MRKFFSVVLVVVMLVAGFALWPTNASANEAVVTFGQPAIRVSPDVQVTLRDEFSYNNFRAYIFTLKNNSPDLAYINAGFGNNMASWDGNYDPVEYQWWTSLIDRAGKNVTPEGWELRLEPESEYTLGLTVEILIVKGAATVFPTITQNPRLKDVTFRLSDGVVYVNWKSAGNFRGESVKMGIWRVPNTLIHTADITDGGGHSIGIETWPKGEYYITYGFISSGQKTIFSPLYYSPGQ